MRLTGQAVRAAAASAALLDAAYLLGYPRLAVLGMGGLAALALAVAAVARAPAVEISRDIFPSRVSRGEPAVGMLRVRNTSRWAGVQIEARESLGGDEVPVPVPYLRRGSSREVGYQLPTSRRGVIAVGPLMWERADAIGLVRRRQSLADSQQLYVHPVTHPFPPASVLRAQRWDSSAADAALSGTITFHLLREYVPGDDLRHVHWRSTARHGTLMVRHNIDPSAPRTTVLLVTGRGAYRDPDLFEEAVEVAASALLAAARERLPARLWTTQPEVLNGCRGLNDARMFLDFLAGVALSDTAGLGPAADRMEHAERGGLLVIATGSLDAADLAVLRRVAVRYDHAVVALLGAACGASPAARQAPVSVVEAASAAEFCARWGELAPR